MHTEALRRKARLRAALTLAGETMRGFAARHDVTPQHLAAVLRGDRESERLTGQIDRYIAEHGETVRARVA